MTRINTNIAALRGLHSVQNAQNSLGTSLTRLSTGLQINSGADNPSGLIASDLLESQITAINQSINNSNLANNVISTADSALGQVSSLLDQVRGLVQGGLNSGAISSDQRDANQQQIDSALAAINQISSNTTFAGAKLLDGSKSFTTTVSSVDTGKLSDFQVNQAVFGASSTISIAATVTTAAAQGSLVYQGGNLTAPTSIELSGSKGSQVLSFGSSATYGDIGTAINAVTDVTGVQATYVTGAATTGTITVDPTGGAAGTKDSVDYQETGGNNDITFAAAANGYNTGTNAASVSFVFNASTSVSTTSASATGNAITVTLASTDGTTSASKASDVVAAVAANTSTSALVTASLATTLSGGDSTNDGSGTFGTSFVSSAGTDDSADFGETGGNNDIQVIATNPAANTGTNAITVSYVLNASTSVSTTSATASGNDITVTLASTDGTTSASKASDVTAAFAANTDVTALVSASLATTLPSGDVSNDGSGVFGDSYLGAASTLSGGSDPVVIAAGTLAGGTDQSLNDNGIVLTNSSSGLQTTANSINFVLNSDTTVSAPTVSVSGTAITVTLASTDGTSSISKASDITAAINANTDASALVTASLDTAQAGYTNGSGVFDFTTAAQTFNGTNSTTGITLTSTNYGSAEFVDVNALSGAFETDDVAGTAGVAKTRDAGADIVVNINGQNAYGKGLTASVNDANLSASLSFTAANNTANNTATVTVTGGGSLFQIGQEVSSNGQIGIGIESINTARLGGIDGKLYELGSGQGKSLSNVGPNLQGSTLVNIINEAITKVSTLRARLGSVQKNVIQTNISTLGVALENISQAKSQITDTDFAAETANLTKAQILNQASISVLSIANQTPNQVLKLLQ